MKMKKFLFTCAAVAGVSAALAANAFAEVVENDTYNKEAGTVSIKTSLTDKAGDQMTVLIIPADAYEKGTITDSDIIYIDQAEALADANIFQNMGLLNGTALDGDEYYIKIGGENIAQDGIIVEKFTVKTTSEGVKVQLGDVNNDTVVNVGDINPIIQHILGSEILTGRDFAAADTTEDTVVNVGDINPVIQHILGSSLLGEIDYTPAAE